jgi:hypothetical protein
VCWAYVTCPDIWGNDGKSLSGWFDEGFDEAQMKFEIVEDYVLFALCCFDIQKFSSARVNMFTKQIQCSLWCRTLGKNYPELFKTCQLKNAK